MKYLLGLDIGTSGVKGLIASVDGSFILSRTCTYPLFTPNSGWAEQNPEDWWNSTKDVISKVLYDSSINPGDILGISLSGQMHSSVFLDEKNEVIRKAILWSDTRTSKQCKEIYERAGGVSSLFKHVSNPALEGFTAPKILWLRENEPCNYEKVRKVIMPKDYIRYKLTGEIFAEESDAAGTLLFDVKNRKWSQEVLENLQIDRSMLPEVIKSVDVAGKITKDIEMLTGLKVGTPVIAGGADNACGAVGSGIVKDGRVLVSIGSSGVVLAQSNSSNAYENSNLHLFNHSNPDKWYMMGVMLSAGMAYKWMREKLFIDENSGYEQLNEIATSVKPGSEGLLFLPYLYGERTPHADAHARGVYFGISGLHDKRHFVRSLLEGVTFGLKDSLELIKKQGIGINEIRIIGGGARSELWQQILADIFDTEISLLNVEEGPAFGAALIAGVGIGAYENFQEATESIIKIKKVVSPDKNSSKVYDEYYKIYTKLYSTLKHDFALLNQISNISN